MLLRSAAVLAARAQPIADRHRGGWQTERMSRRPSTAIIRGAGRYALAALLLAAGASHLTWGRRGYRIVVPDWAPRAIGLDEDAIVVASGAVEIMLGAGLIVLPADKGRIGVLVAAFFAAVFPGNVHQWRTGRSAPMLRTDRARFIRLFLQPVLIAWALASTRRGRAA